MGVSVGKMVATAAVAGAVGLGAVGVAGWANSGGTGNGTTATLAAQTASTVSASGSVKARHPGGPRGLLRRADHGTFEVKNKAGQWVTYTFDRGKVTAASGQSITLARPDGQSVTLTITPETKFRGVASAADIKTGKGAIVVSDSAGKALIVAQRDPRAKPAQPAQNAPTTAS